MHFLSHLNCRYYNIIAILFLIFAVFQTHTNTWCNLIYTLKSYDIHFIWLKNSISLANQSHFHKHLVLWGNGNPLSKHHHKYLQIISVDFSCTLQFISCFPSCFSSCLLCHANDESQSHWNRWTPTFILPQRHRQTILSYIWPQATLTMTQSSKDICFICCHFDISKKILSL